MKSENEEKLEKKGRSLKIRRCGEATKVKEEVKKLGN